MSFFIFLNQLSDDYGYDFGHYHDYENYHDYGHDHDYYVNDSQLLVIN